MGKIDIEKGQGAHIVVVGGSGMLTGFCLSLAKRGYCVSVICRSQTKFERNLGKNNARSISPIYVDYRNDEKLAQAIANAKNNFGPIVGTVAWIHPEQSTSAPGVVAEYTEERFIVVLGSTDGRWDAAQPVINSIRSSNPSLSVHAVALGHVHVPSFGTTRWLTNKEISAGVLEAFDKALPHFVVGALSAENHRGKLGWHYGQF